MAKQTACPAEAARNLLLKQATARKKADLVSVVSSNSHRSTTANGNFFEDIGIDLEKPEPHCAEEMEFGFRSTYDLD
jgi:hypothetical protein